MASRIEGLKQSLAEYILHNVEKTGGKTMLGCYGKVQVVEINKCQCALKTLHPYLVEDVSAPLDNFVEECRILAKMKHPNVVQFLGDSPTKAPRPGL